MLIPQTTHGKTVSLTVVEPVDIAENVIQVAVPGIVSTALRRTPPVTADATVDECPTAAAVATRKT